MSESFHIVCPPCPLVNWIPLKLTAANFQKHITRNDIPALVDFRTPCCTLREMMTSAFEQSTIQLEFRIRLATHGKRALRNTQPFIRALAGRVHLFAQNGELAGIERDRNFKWGRFQPVGNTDSELVFCSLLDRLAPLWEAGGGRREAAQFHHWRRVPAINARSGRRFRSVPISLDRFPDFSPCNRPLTNMMLKIRGADHGLLPAKWGSLDWTILTPQIICG